MATVGAYVLKRAPGAESFRAAWDAALNFGVQTLTDLAIDRVKHGVPVPIFWKGEQVGERRRYNERLHMFILKHHQPHVYNPPQLRTGTKHLETLKREWRQEDARRAGERADKAVAAFFRNVDNVRGRLLQHAHRLPEHRAAWELIVGPIDWDRVAAWEQGQPTKFQYENITCASTHLALLQRVEEDSDVTVADLIFGPLIDPEDGTLNPLG